MMCGIVTKSLPHTDLQNQNRTPDLAIGNMVIICLTPVDFNHTHQQTKQWSPLNFTSGQGVTEQQAPVGWFIMLLHWFQFIMTKWLFGCSTASITRETPKGMF